jgi:hypothetical protein
VKELPEDGTVVPKHAGVTQDYYTAYVVCAFSCFGKRKLVYENAGTKQIQNTQSLYGITLLTN